MDATSPESGLSAGRTASRTALEAARLRAVHLLLDDPPPVFEDPLALRLLDPGAERAIREHADRFRTAASRAIRADVVARSRWAEDSLREAVRRGVRQYVILGAGLDTFAYRQPDWARSLTIVEVDHAASREDKLARLGRAGIEPPPNLHLVAADLEGEALAPALDGAGFDTTEPAFVACLGVLIYLSEGAADAIFEMTGGLAAGSELAFTFSRPDASTAAPPAAGSAAARMEAIGEPWRTRFDAAALTERLRSAGFRSIDFLNAEDVTGRYLRGRGDGLRAPSRVVYADALV